MIFFICLNNLFNMLVMVFNESFNFLLENNGYYQIIGVSFILFFGGLLKIFFTKRNLLLLMLGIETMMLGLIILSLSSFLSICLVNPFNYLIVFKLLTLVVSESVIGLILVLLLSKSFGSIDIYKLNKLKG